MRELQGRLAKRLEKHNIPPENSFQAFKEQRPAPD